MPAHRSPRGQSSAGAGEQTSASQGFAFSHLRLPLPFSERRLLLTGLDLLAVVGALLLLAWLWPADRSGWRLLVRYPGWFAALIGIWLPLAHAFDAYDLRVSSRFTTAAPAVVRAGLLTTVVYYLLRPPFVEAGVNHLLLVLAGCTLTVVLLFAGRGLYVAALFQPPFNRRSLIVGAGWAGRTIARTIAEQGGGMYQLLGFVDDDPAKEGAVVLQVEKPSGGEMAPSDEQADQARGMPGANGIPSELRVVGDRHALRDLVADLRVTTVILAITHEVSGALLQTLMDCLELGVEIVPMPLLYEQLTGRVPVEHVGDNWYVSMPVNHSGTGTLWPLVKRAVDVVLASIGLLLLTMATPFIAAAIYLDNPGPIFYTQERVGKGGRRFRAYKFRSMVVDAETGEAVWATKNDKRITGVGRFLRKTHLDEFPQFVNIIKGEMSAVGPRPERPEFVEELAREIPFFRVRHAVRPGMAGWALVKHGYVASREATVLKLQYDLYYVKHQSLWLDIVILLKTFVDSLALRGR